MDDPEVVEVQDGPSAAKAPKRTPSKEDEDLLLRNYLDERKKHNEASITWEAPTTSVYDMITKAMEDYETRGIRPPALEQIYSALLSIPPTSAEVRVALHCRSLIFIFGQAHSLIMNWVK